MDRLIKSIIAFIITLVFYGAFFTGPTWFPQIGDMLLNANIIISMFVLIVPPIIVIGLIGSIFQIL